MDQRNRSKQSHISADDNSTALSWLRKSYLLTFRRKPITNPPYIADWTDAIAWLSELYEAAAVEILASLRADRFELDELYVAAAFIYGMVAQARTDSTDSELFNIATSTLRDHILDGSVTVDGRPASEHFTVRHWYTKNGPVMRFRAKILACGWVESVKGGHEGIATRYRVNDINAMNSLPAITTHNPHIAFPSFEDTTTALISSLMGVSALVTAEERRDLLTTIEEYLGTARVQYEHDQAVKKVVHEAIRAAGITIHEVDRDDVVKSITYTDDRGDEQTFDRHAKERYLLNPPPELADIILAAIDAATTPQAEQARAKRREYNRRYRAKQAARKREQELADGAALTLKEMREWRL